MQYSKAEYKEDVLRDNLRGILRHRADRGKPTEMN